MSLWVLLRNIDLRFNSFREDFQKNVPFHPDAESWFMGANVVHRADGEVVDILASRIIKQEKIPTAIAICLLDGAPSIKGFYAAMRSYAKLAELLDVKHAGQNKPGA